ncbi:DBH-like monooxygenase protein 1 [Orchesella cincta]|uniref:DBH-like monooxygenase protein 1 n=1 Tax=Orchesella cincta TaxID=48709 RepID=A0A1D2M879_ORCCI|nr:DBH-like monooxygenase protein 1 [Orchesella cincta]
MDKKLVLVVALVLLQVQMSLGHLGHDHGTDEGKENNDSEWLGAHSLALKVLQGVDFRWLASDNETVTMEMSSFTKGYVSLGFCPKWKGTMEGCDIVLGWVNNTDGTAQLFDYYAKTNTLPELDASQDYELLAGTQEHGKTTIKFRRKWSTGDENDADFENNVRVMWAWHPEDPFSPASYFKHAGNSRGHMNDDISLKNPSLNHHHHQHLHSAGFSVQATSFVVISCLFCLFTLFHV